ESLRRGRLSLLQRSLCRSLRSTAGAMGCAPDAGVAQTSPPVTGSRAIGHRRIPLTIISTACSGESPRAINVSNSLLSTLPIAASLVARAPRSASRFRSCAGPHRGRRVALLWRCWLGHHVRWVRDRWSRVRLHRGLMLTERVQPGGPFFAVEVGLH